jgi:hypothetical protein
MFYVTFNPGARAVFITDMNHPFRRALLPLIITILHWPGAALAQMQAQANKGQPQVWDFGLWAAGSSGEESTNSFAEAQILTAGLYVGRAITGELGRGWRRGWFEYGFDFSPLFAQFTPQRIHGTAFDPVVFRWLSTGSMRRATPFLELGGGGVYTSMNFPAGDTSTFNFIARGGGGILVATRPNQAIELSCRWWHISNANLGTRNPEFNGIQVGLGYHWFK